MSGVVRFLRFGLGMSILAPDLKLINTKIRKGLSNMSSRGEYKKNIKSICKKCGKESLGNKKRQYCTDSCRNKAWYNQKRRDRVSLRRIEFLEKHTRNC